MKNFINYNNIYNICDNIIKNNKKRKFNEKIQIYINILNKNKFNIKKNTFLFFNTNINSLNDYKIGLILLDNEINDILNLEFLKYYGNIDLINNINNNKNIKINILISTEKSYKIFKNKIKEIKNKKIIIPNKKNSMIFNINNLNIFIKSIKENNKILYKINKNGIITCVLCYITISIKDIVENIITLIKEINIKFNNNIKSIYIHTSMGKSFKLDY